MKLAFLFLFLAFLLALLFIRESKAHTALIAPQYQYPDLVISTRTFVNAKVSREIHLSTVAASASSINVLFIEGNLYILNLYE